MDETTQPSMAEDIGREIQQRMRDAIENSGGDCRGLAQGTHDEARCPDCGIEWAPTWEERPDCPRKAAKGFAEEVDNPLDREAFREIADQAYGWTVAWDGELAGLIAGDMGYEGTGVNVGVLVAHALAETSGKPEGQEIDQKLYDLVTTCWKALTSPLRPGGADIEGAGTDGD